MSDLINIQKAETIKGIFSKYNYFDLCRAVFCFNSWRYTRPHLQFYLTLNQALCTADRKGNIEIETYSDFVNFCNDISQYYDGTFDDEIVPDFGETKISFNGENYAVFLGTGHNFVFPCMESLEVIANGINSTKEIERVLNYVDEIVSTYRDIERYDINKYDNQKLVLPTEQYYNVVRENYKKLNLSEQDFLLQLAYSSNRLIEETHFIKDDIIYPLFNPSIIIDSISILYRNCGKIDFNKIANTIIYKSLIENYDINPEGDRIKSNVAIITNNERKELLGNFFFNFLVVDGDSLLFFINREQHCKDDIDNIIRQTKDKVSQKNLCIIEPINPPICKQYDFSFIKTVNFLLYDNKIILGNLFERNKYFNGISINLYDAVSIIYQSHSSKEIVEFFNRPSINESISIYSGYSAIFEAWLMQNKEFSPGAFNVSNIFTDVYLVEWNIFEKFIDLEQWYPFNSYNEMFLNPFSWTILNEQVLGFRRMISNNAYGFSGCYRKVNNTYLFLAFNMAFEDDQNYNVRSENIKMVEELIERNIVIFEDDLIKCNFYNFNGVQILYMPQNYARKVDHNGFLSKNKEYVYSDASVQNDKLLIRFAVNEEKLMQDILNAKDKIIECKFMEELFSCVENVSEIDFNGIKKGITSKQHDKKDIEAIEMELKYIFSNKNLGFWPEDEVFVKVRKNIAYDCKMAGIKPGIYSSKKATEIVRKIQKLTIPCFETIISQYDKIDLHYILLSNVSYYIHKKRIEINRYSVVDNKLLSDKAKSHTAENTIKAREESREQIRDINYLIDTNLAISHVGIVKPSYEEVKYLLAYSHWLLVLQEISDQTNYDLFESKIKIDDDFVVSANLSNTFEKDLSVRQKRVYDNTDYVPTNQDKEKMFKKSLEAFYQDTGVHLDFIIKTCEYLSKEFSATFSEQKIPDVYIIPRDKLVKDYISILIEKSEKNISDFDKALDYLTIDTTKIKKLGEEDTDFVPVWEREMRDVRFDVRPILKVGNDLIFSPVVMYELFQIWLFGTFDFYPPYEYGLDKFRKSLDEWKSIYEKQMEKDIANYFSSLGYIVKQNLKLHKLDKKYGHPNNLGDYDIVAIDKQKKIVWNIESKFLGKVGSIKEYYNHQDSFFNKDKKDEKYSRRIEYFEEHKDVILCKLGISGGNNYLINNYMVTNKVFTSELKKINFTIITFDELKKTINDKG